MSSEISLLSSPPRPEQVTTLRLQVQAVNQVSRLDARVLCGNAVGVDQRSWKRWEDNDRRMSPALWELALLKLRTGVPQPGASVPPEAAQVLALRTRIQERRDATDVQARVICGTAVDVDQRTWKRWEDGMGPMAPALWELAKTKLQTGNPIPVNSEGMYAELLHLIQEREAQERRDAQEKEAQMLAEKLANENEETADK